MDALTIEDASKALGVSKDAVRKRLERGTLQGRKTDDGWTVYLPEHEGRNPDISSEVVALRVENEMLKKQLERVESLLDSERQMRSQESERRDVLIARVMDQLPPPPQEVPKDRRSWWQRFVWR